MRKPQHHFDKKSQRGAALMVMLVIIVVGAAAFLVSSLSTSALKTARQEKTSDALIHAKEALIGYAITYGDDPSHSSPQVHGYLPCPDTDASNGEGSSKLSCGSKNISVIGRLPWRELKLSPLRDGDGECFWYAVSGTYKNNPKTDLMNWDNNGLFEILDASGASIAQNVVAVVFAPGSVLGGQNRASDGNAPICGGNYTASNYLDSDGAVNNAVVSGTANAISQFRIGASAQLNDRMIFITRDDIFNAKNIRTKLDAMTQKVAECIAYFGTKNSILGIPDLANKSLPWPAQLTLANYFTNTNYNDKVDIFAGRIPYKVNTARNTSNNTISDEFLLKSDGANCPNWSATYPWWDNWKDHLFYAIGENFKPISGATNTCLAVPCLKVNGAGNFAAVIMFAGRRLSGQNRADKSVAADYLEGFNAGHVASPNPPTDGNEDYQTAASSSVFNDILYCIDENLAVAKCP